MSPARKHAENLDGREPSGDSQHEGSELSAQELASYGGAKVGQSQNLETELERFHQIIHDLRNPVGSVHMGIQMLLGPLRSVLNSLEQQTARRVESTLTALEESAKQLRHLVTDALQQPLERAAANDSSNLPAGNFEKRGIVQEPSANQTNLEDDPVLQAPASDSEAERSTSTTQEQGVADDRPKIEHRASSVEIEDILRRLEILTVTRSSLPALLAVDCEPGLKVHCNGPELLRALSNLVENAIEASSKFDPKADAWTIEISGTNSDDSTVCIEIRNRGEAPPSELLQWIALPEGAAAPPISSKQEVGLHGIGLKGVRRIVERYGGRLEAEARDGVTHFRLRFPARVGEG